VRIVVSWWGGGRCEAVEDAKVDVDLEVEADGEGEGKVRKHGLEFAVHAWAVM
jgi:hypothetical protein